MNRDEKKSEKKRKLLLRKESIRTLDTKDLSHVAGGAPDPHPPDGGVPLLYKLMAQ